MRIKERIKVLCSKEIWYKCHKRLRSFYTSFLGLIYFFLEKKKVKTVGESVSVTLIFYLASSYLLGVTEFVFSDLERTLQMINIDYFFSFLVGLYKEIFFSFRDSWGFLFWTIYFIQSELCSLLTVDQKVEKMNGFYRPRSGFCFDHH